MLSNYEDDIQTFRSLTNDKKKDTKHTDADKNRSRKKSSQKKSAAKQSIEENSFYYTSSDVGYSAGESQSYYGGTDEKFQQDYSYSTQSLDSSEYASEYDVESDYQYSQEDKQKIQSNEQSSETVGLDYYYNYDNFLEEDHIRPPSTAMRHTINPSLFNAYHGARTSKPSQFDTTGPSNIPTPKKIISSTIRPVYLLTTSVTMAPSRSNSLETMKYREVDDTTVSQNTPITLTQDGSKAFQGSTRHDSASESVVHFFGIWMCLAVFLFICLTLCNRRGCSKRRSFDPSSEDVEQNSSLLRELQMT